MILSFTYKNYKGITSDRMLDVECLEYLTNPGFDYEPGWFLTGIDVHKGERRSFSLDHIIFPPEPPLPTVACRIDLK